MSDVHPIENTANPIKAQMKDLTQVKIFLLPRSINGRRIHLRTRKRTRNIFQGKQFYFKGRDESLISEDGKLKAFGKLKSILRKNRLCDFGFDLPGGKTNTSAVCNSKQNGRRNAFYV